MSRRGRHARGRCRHDHKVTFATWAAAQRQANRMPIPARVYWCQAAGGYHITSIETTEYDRRRSGARDDDAEEPQRDRQPVRP